MEKDDFFLDGYDIVIIAKALAYFELTKKVLSLSLFEARRAIYKKRQTIERLNFSGASKQRVLEEFEEMKLALYKHVFVCNIVKLERAQLLKLILAGTEVSGNVFLFWNSIIRENPDWLVSLYTAISLLVVNLLKQGQKNKINKYARIAQIISNNFDGNCGR